MSKKYVYLFSEGNASMRELLGGKGANLAEMSNIGLPVPQGFTITTEACTQYYEDGRKINDEIMAEIMKNVETMEQINGKKFGDLENPLLVSVRSGARASMPAVTEARTYLGAMHYTTQEMERPIAALSGGQRAKVLLLKLGLTATDVLLLDEPTRNFSPLSGPEIRAMLRDFPGAIIAVSHDRKFIAEVCTRVLRLTENGLEEEK